MDTTFVYVFVAGKKVAFVTGASGFVGGHLVYQLLERGYSVTALVRSTGGLSAFYSLAGLYPDANTSEITWVEGDLLSPDEWIGFVNNVDVVFHAAAVVSFSAKNKKEMMETNVQGTAHVVNACLLHQKTLVYVSSVAALGRAEGQVVVNETTTWKETEQNTHYAVSKHLAEREVWRGVEEGLAAAIVCPGIIIGPWPKSTGSGQIPALVKKKMPFYPVGENGFTGVRDVVGMMIAMYEESCFGRKVLCVTENISYREVLNRFALGFGISPPGISLSGWRLYFLYHFSHLAERIGVPFPFPSQGLKSTSLKTHYLSVNLSLLKTFSYRPLNESIEETLSLIHI